MQQQGSFGAIAVHLQQYRGVAVTTVSIINEQRFLIMAIYPHPRVYFFCGKVRQPAWQQRHDGNANRCFYGKRKNNGKQ